MSLNDADQRAVDVGPIVVEHLLLPLAEVAACRSRSRGRRRRRRVPACRDRRTRPDSSTRRGSRRRAAPSVACLRGTRRTGRGSAAMSLRVWCRPSLTRSSESGDGRAEYCIATVAQSPRVEQLEDHHGRVVDVAGAGRRREHDPRRARTRPCARARASSARLARPPSSALSRPTYARIGVAARGSPMTSSITSVGHTVHT